MATLHNGNAGPPSKKRMHGAADRVTLNVGGTRFASAASTLSSNSAYFASLLSENWSGGSSGDGNGNDEIFLDEDPLAFGRLLAYMRRGMIDVGDVDGGVLLLAEFLGVERLLLGVRVRAYRQLHPRLPPMSDAQISARFDEKYGGIREALASGVLPKSLMEEVVPPREYAILDLAAEQGSDRHDMVTVIRVDANQSNEENLESVHIIGALNWLNHHGFVTHEDQLTTMCITGSTMTFSRIKPLQGRKNPSAEDIFIPETTVGSEEKRWKKQYVMLRIDVRESRFMITAPSQLHQDTNEHANVSATAVVEEEGAWLERNRFVDREAELEELFRPWLGNDMLVTELIFPDSNYKLTSFRIYSRKIECLHRGEMWHVEE